MSDHPIKGLMDTTLEKIREMVDVNTIIGEPIVTSDGTTIIPVSKIVYGFASGGSEFGNKHQPSANLFGGGGGAGVTIDPVAFLAVSHGEVKLLSISHNNGGQAIAMIPELLDKVTDLFKKNKKKEDKEDKEKDETDEGLADPKV